jgi:hypothetical protein
MRMKLVLMGSLALLMLGSAALAQEEYQGGWIARPFVEGGRVRLDLSSADYTVRAGGPDRVRIQWTPGHDAKATALKTLSVDVRVAGRQATIVTGGPAKHAHFVIEVPARSDVSLRMRAGDVELEGIEGHTDVRMTAGDLKIRVRPELLARAHASVTFGDLDARALGISKSGIKQSLDWIGGGSYALDARLGAGDITLVP